MISDFSILKKLSFEPLDTPLTPEEISTFEQLNSIVVPEEYKYFLTTIGKQIKNTIYGL